MVNVVKEIATHIESDHYYETKAMSNGEQTKSQWWEHGYDAAMS